MPARTIVQALVLTVVLTDIAGLSRSSCAQNAVETAPGDPPLLRAQADGPQPEKIVSGAAAASGMCLLTMGVLSVLAVFLALAIAFRRHDRAMDMAQESLSLQRRTHDLLAESVSHQKEMVRLLERLTGGGSPET
jgi:hypothetical protein